MQWGVFESGQEPLTGGSVAFRLSERWIKIKMSGGPKAKVGDLQTAAGVIKSPLKVVERGDFYYFIAEPAEQFIDRYTVEPSEPGTVFVVKVKKQCFTITDCGWHRPSRIKPTSNPADDRDAFVRRLGQEVRPHAST